MPVLQPYGNRRQVLSRIEVCEGFRVRETNERCPNAFQHAPRGRVSTARQRLGDRHQSIDWPNGAQRLTPLGSFGHRRTAARCVDEAREQVIRKHGRITRADGDRTCTQPFRPRKPHLDSCKWTGGITRGIVKNGQPLSSSQGVRLRFGASIDGHLSAAALQSLHGPHQQGSAGQFRGCLLSAEPDRAAAGDDDADHRACHGILLSSLQCTAHYVAVGSQEEF
jgi:hypothetical protein